MAEQAQGESAADSREGARWINYPPTPAQFADWFKENVRIDDGLDHENYVGGCVLIPATEKRKEVTSLTAEGPVIADRERLTFTPYAKVDTRLAYFWDLVSAHADEGWSAVIEPVKTQRPSPTAEHIERTLEDGTQEVIDRSRFGAMAQVVEQMPPGFWLTSVPVGDSYTHFVCCTWRVAIYKGDGQNPIREGVGTKQVALVRSNFRGDRTWADENALMKAETGAKGRALGFAGILVIPGSGVATAEDMIEEATNPQAAAASAPQETPDGGKGADAPAEPSAPQSGAEQAADERQTLLDQAKVTLKELSDDYPEAYQAFEQWASQRKPPVRDISKLATAALRGVTVKLDRLLGEAKARAEARGEEEPAEPAPDAPAPEGGPPEAAPEEPSAPEDA